jgi:hypothetical protein
LMPAGRVHARPSGVEGDAERFTVPVRPFKALIVMVEAPEEPAFTTMLEGLAAILKSVKAKVAEVECTNDPLMLMPVIART